MIGMCLGVKPYFGGSGDGVCEEAKRSLAFLHVYLELYIRFGDV